MKLHEIGNVTNKGSNSLGITITIPQGKNQSTTNCVCKNTCSSSESSSNGSISITFSNTKTEITEENKTYIHGNVINQAQNDNNDNKISFQSYGEISRSVVARNKGSNIVTFDASKLGLTGFIKGDVINESKDSGRNEIKLQGGGAIFGSVINRNENASQANCKCGGIFESIVNGTESATTSTDSSSMNCKCSNVVQFYGRSKGIIYGNVEAHKNGSNYISFGDDLTKVSMDNKTQRICTTPDHVNTQNNSSFDNLNGGCGEIRGNILNAADSKGQNKIIFFGDGKISDVTNNSKHNGVNFIVFAGSQDKKPFSGSVAQDQLQNTSIVNGNITNTGSGSNVIYFTQCHGTDNFSMATAQSTSCQDTTSNDTSGTNKKTHFGGSRSFVTGNITNTGSGSNVIIFGAHHNDSHANVNLTNSSKGSNNIYFFQGGYLKASFKNTGSGDNNIYSGVSHLSESNFTYKSNPYIYGRPDVRIYTSIPNAGSTNESMLKFKPTTEKTKGDVKAPRKPQAYNVLYLSDAISDLDIPQKQTSVIINLYIDKNGFHCKTGSNSCACSSSCSSSFEGFNQNKMQGDAITYGKAHSDRIISSAHNTLYQIYPIFEQKSKCTTSNGANDYGDRNLKVLQSIKYVGGGTEESCNVPVITIKNSVKSNNFGKDGRTYAVVPEFKEGFDVIKPLLKEVITDEFGATTSSKDTTTDTRTPKVQDHTTFFLNGISRHVDVADKNAMISASTVGLQLFSANFNSLNKRLGELRNNDKSNALWARAFAGYQVSNLVGTADYRGYVASVPLHSFYQTLQTGYDYAFDYENGFRSYVGIAAGLSNANIKGQISRNRDSVNGTSQGLQSALSNGLEVGLYHSYIGSGASIGLDDDTLTILDPLLGIYSDTIIKVGFIKNDFKLAHNTSNKSANNKTISASQEIGYRLNITKAFAITPEFEFSYGYIDPIKSLENKQGSATLKSAQDGGTHIYKARLGTSFQFASSIADLPIKTHAGAYTDYQVIKASQITLATNTKLFVDSAGLDPLNATSLNLGLSLGSNIELSDNLRLYGELNGTYLGAINKLYEINAGLRFGF
ncbi:MAG: autotransporter domain-containing protein [Helicobacter sp.]|nr:autotransporter domain-containing protein [Helicobacter sp.]